MTDHVYASSLQTEETTLADAARARLRRAIITHELKPEEKISEAALAVRFGFTKATMRSAIASLLEEGLIVSRSLRAQHVAPLTLSDVKHVYHLRHLLEPDATREAAGRVDGAQLRALNNQRDLARAGDDEAETEFRILENNKAFHMTIAEAGGNMRQARWIGQLQDASMRILWLGLQSGNRRGEWNAGHDEIIEALVRGDGDVAADLALKHLQNGERLVLDRIAHDSTIGGISISARPTSKDRGRPR